VIDLASFEAELRGLREDLLRLIDDHRRDPTPERGILLRQVRLELALGWVRLPVNELPRAFGGIVGELHERMMYSGLRELPLSPEEVPIATQLRAAVARGWCHVETPAAFLGTTLFGPAHGSDVPLDLAPAPEWAWGPALRHLFEVPRLFVEPGEADRYLAFARRVMVWLASQAAQAAPGPLAKRAFAAFADSAFLVQAFFTEDDLRELLEMRAFVLERMVAPHTDLDAAPRRAAAPRARRRIGILAPDLDPQTETYLLLSHYEHLDRARFEVVLYTLAPRASALFDVCAACADRVVVLPAADLAGCAARLRADGLDALVFGSNLTAASSASAKLALFRLATVQLATINCPATTGLRHVDAFLSPELGEPAGAQSHYGERLVLLPGLANVFAYRHDTAVPATPAKRETLGVPADAVLFASGASYFKFLPELDDTCGRVLAAVPGSHLLLYPFNPNGAASYETAALVQRIRRRVAAHGVDPARVVIAPPVASRADAQELLRLADVYLDGFPYSGSCSLVDPLQVGVPPVVRDGAVMRARQGAAILRALGLDELVTAADASYEALAIALGRDPSRRSRLREEIAAHMKSPALFDTAAFSRAVGEALELLLSSASAREAA
jgi:predicted O-linked N-acetylglucosamine transferase (SPINDLY family)